MLRLWKVSKNWHCSGFFTLLRTLDLEATLGVLTYLIATRAVNGRLYYALMYDWNTRVRAGLGSSWVAHVLLSVRVPE